jgi:hypothetical protein
MVSWCCFPAKNEGEGRPKHSPQYTRRAWLAGVSTPGPRGITYTGSRRQPLIVVVAVVVVREPLDTCVSSSPLYQPNLYAIHTRRYSREAR